LEERLTDRRHVAVLLEVEEQQNGAAILGRIEVRCFRTQVSSAVCRIGFTLPSLTALLAASIGIELGHHRGQLAGSYCGSPRVSPPAKLEGEQADAGTGDDFHQSRKT
jgi:hypothetical protein